MNSLSLRFGNEVLEQRRLKIIERHGKPRQTDFVICRRAAGVPFNQYAEEDRLDRCRQCGEEVIYSSRRSDASTPHVCVRCAYLSSRFRGLDSLTPNEKDLNDKEYLARLELATAQNRGGETYLGRDKAKPHLIKDNRQP